MRYQAALRPDWPPIASTAGAVGVPMARLYRRQVAIRPASMRVRRPGSKRSSEAGRDPAPAQFGLGKGQFSGFRLRAAFAQYVPERCHDQHWNRQHNQHPDQPNIDRGHAHLPERFALRLAYRLQGSTREESWLWISSTVLGNGKKLILSGGNTFASEIKGRASVRTARSASRAVHLHNLCMIQTIMSSSTATGTASIASTAASRLSRNA